MSIYAHAIEQNDREAANAIGNVLGLQKPTALERNGPSR